MSGLALCCGVRWSTGLYSDALYVEGVERSPGGNCGRCGKPLVPGELSAEPQICADPACGAAPTVEASVLGGPLLYLCARCGEAFQAACKDLGLASRVTPRPGCA